MATIQRRPGRGGQQRYRVQVRLLGQVRSATLPTWQAARHWAAVTEGTIRLQGGTKTSEALYHTLGDLLERYRREILPGKGPGTQAHQGPQLAWWSSQLGGLRLDQVTPARLATCKEQLAETRAPATVNRYLAALSHALNTAVVEWGWLEASPLHRIRRLREPRGRVRFLTEEERPRLLAACQASPNRCLYPVVLLAVSTGARKQEILSLTWRDIDLRRGQLTLPITKNGEPRTLPLVGLALETVHTLARVRRIDTPLLFPRADGQAPLDVRYAFHQALRQAGIADFRFHDLRHTFASYLAMQGASLLEMAEALGHKTLAMVQRYAHLTDSHTRGVVARMCAAILP